MRRSKKMDRRSCKTTPERQRPSFDCGERSPELQKHMKPYKVPKDVPREVLG